MSRFSGQALVILDDGSDAIGRVVTRTVAGVHLDVGDARVVVAPEYVLEHDDLRDGERASAWCARLFGVRKADDIMRAAKVPA